MRTPARTRRLVAALAAAIAVPALAVTGASGAQADPAPGSSFSPYTLAPTCTVNTGRIRCEETFSASGYVHAWTLGTSSPVGVTISGGRGGDAADGTRGGDGGMVSTTISTGAAAYRIGLGGNGGSGGGRSNGDGGGAAGVGGGVGAQTYSGGAGGSGTSGGYGGGGGGGASVVAVTPALSPNRVTGGDVALVAPGGGGAAWGGSNGGGINQDGRGAFYRAGLAWVVGYPAEGGVSGGRAASSTAGGAGGSGSPAGAAGVAGAGGAGAGTDGSCTVVNCLTSHPVNGGGGGGGGVYGGGGGAVVSVPPMWFDQNGALLTGAGGAGFGSYKANRAIGDAQATISWWLDDTATSTSVALSAPQVDLGGSVQATATVKLANLRNFPVIGARVQFLLDGQAYGNPVDVPDSGKVMSPITVPTGGDHQVTAQVVAGGLLKPSTSAPAKLLVSGNLVRNGGFEQPALAAGAWTILAGDGSAVPGWTSSRNIEVQNTADAAEGKQFVELDTDRPSSVQTTFPTEAGGRYQVSFRYAGRPGAGADDNTMYVWTDLGNFGNGSTLWLSDDAQTVSTRQWKTWTGTFTAPATNAAARLAFADPGRNTSGLGMQLDDVMVKKIG